MKNYPQSNPNPSDGGFKAGITFMVLAFILGFLSSLALIGFGVYTLVDKDNFITDGISGAVNLVISGTIAVIAIAIAVVLLVVNIIFLARTVRVAKSKVYGAGTIIFTFLTIFFGGTIFSLIAFICLLAAANKHRMRPDHINQMAPGQFQNQPNQYYNNQHQNFNQPQGQQPYYQDPQQGYYDNQYNQQQGPYEQ